MNTIGSDFSFTGNGVNTETRVFGYGVKTTPEGIFATSPQVPQWLPVTDPDGDQIAVFDLIAHAAFYCERPDDAYLIVLHPSDFARGVNDGLINPARICFEGAAVVYRAPIAIAENHHVWVQTMPEELLMEKSDGVGWATMPAVFTQSGQRLRDNQGQW